MGTTSTEGPLLAPLTADEWGDDEYSAFGALLGLPGEKVPRAGSGHAADPLKFDIIGLLAHHPKMARQFLAFNGWLLQRGELPVRLRELAVLRVAHTRRSVFFWGEHVKIATEGGVPTEDIDRLACGNDDIRRARPVGTGRHRRTVDSGACRRRNMAAARRRPGHSPGDGIDLRRRHVRGAGDGLRYVGSGAPVGQRRAA